MTQKITKILSYYVLFICFSARTLAATSITTTSVSGHWTLAGSPYLVYNDIQVDATNSLSIDPGVEIIFYGSYMMTIRGILYCVGTASSPINFHVNDTSGWYSATVGLGGWKGISFALYKSTLADTSSLQYCNVFDMKDQSVSISRPLNISNCNFYHNKTGALGCYVDYGNIIEIKKCNFYNNLGQEIIGMGAKDPSLGTVRFDSNNVYGNTSSYSVLVCNELNLLIHDNNFYQNIQTDTINAAIIEISDCIALIEHNKVYENTSMYDGSISSWRSITDINENYVCNNSVLVGGTTGCGHLQGGGGIRIDDESDALISSNTIRNNIIANNYTAYYGSGIFVNGANACINNNTIINNTANRGAIYTFCDPGSTLTVKNNIFYNNVSAIGLSDDTVNMEGTMDTFLYENNWSQHGYSRDIVCLSLSVTLTGDSSKNVIGTNPGLIAPTLHADVTESALTANFALQPGSPCIDKGSTTNINIGPMDYIGHNRVFGSAIDIGAIEYGAMIFLGESPIPGIPNKQISVYPNPASNILFVSVPEVTGKIQLLDVAGRVIAEKMITEKLISFDIHALPRGAYIATWNDGNGTNTTQKIVAE